MKNSIAILTVLTAMSVFAQPSGTLDTTFGNGGKVVTSITPGQDKAYGIAFQTDGKIIVAGHSTSTITGKDFAVVRYNSDGSLDNTFGTNGIVTTDLQAGGEDVAYSVAVQTDGRIVLAGSSDNGSNKNAALVRYTDNGTLDNTFGNNGIVLTDFENLQQDEIKTLKIHALTGKIIVGGSSAISSSIGKPVLARYNSDGTLDATFNNTGIKLLWIAVNDNNRIFSVEDLVLESNLKISCVGYRKNISTSIGIEYWAARVLSNGDMDTSFSSDGVLQYGDGSGSSSAHGLILNSNQDIVLCGSRQFNGNYSFRTLKINQNGTISNPSVSYTSYITGIHKAYKIAEENNGKYIFVGSTGSSTNNSFAVVRINNNLSIDNSFGSNGSVQTTFGNALNECHNLIVQPDNKIVAIGFTGNDFAAARYLGNDLPQLNDFQLASPMNLATNLNYTSVTFDWTNAFGATSYEIEIDLSSSFTTSQTYPTTSSSFTLSNLQPNTQYFWRVKASDGSNWGTPTGVWSFTTNALENFVLTSPSNGSMNQNYNALILNWTDNIGATSYQIQVDTTNNFSTNSQTFSSNISAYTVSLLPSKTYYWKVRASNGTNWGQWTTIWSFTTKADPTSSIHEVYFADIKIYPNPTSDIVFFEANDHLLNKPFKLLDNTGKEIFSGLINGAQVRIELNKLSTGIYLLQIGDYPQQTFKILKE